MLFTLLLFTLVSLSCTPESDLTDDVTQTDEVYATENNTSQNQDEDKGGD